MGSSAVGSLMEQLVFGGNKKTPDLRLVCLTCGGSLILISVLPIILVLPVLVCSNLVDSKLTHRDCLQIWRLLICVFEIMLSVSFIQLLKRQYHLSQLNFYSQNSLFAQIQIQIPFSISLNPDFTPSFFIFERLH